MKALISCIQVAEKERRAAEKQAKKVQEIMAANVAPQFPDSPPQPGRKGQKRAPSYAGILTHITLKNALACQTYNVKAEVSNKSSARVIF